MRKNIIALTMIVIGVCFLSTFSLVDTASGKEPIIVGVPLPMTGAYASDGVGYYRGIRLAIDEINEAGGLLGRPLKMIRFDTQEFAPETVMQAADKLLGRDKVHAVHAGWAGWGQDVRAYGKYEAPFFMYDESISAMKVFREDPKKYSNVFMLGDIEKAIAKDVFDVMEQLPYDYPNKKIAVIVADDSWGTESGTGIKERAKERGWKVSLYEVVPYGTTEWGPILTKIRTIKPAWIYVEIVSAPDVITFFRQFMKAPTNSLINFGYSLVPPEFIDTMGKEANGIMGESITAMPGPKGPTPEANAWLETFREKFGADPQAGSYAVYVGVKIWAEAVEKVGDVKNYRAINQKIATTSFKTITGRMISFDQDHKIPISTWPLTHLQVQDGRLVTIYTRPGEKYLDYEFQIPPWIKTD
ncbi:MAG: ABC transporter substrate-binding protein [Desulfobacteraceae bacterium]|nr:MAG: ABC transporter substrate-binding protein [Desulfobacteraceae bacterium]